MARVVITPKAFADLEEVRDYIANDNEETARKYVDKILSRVGKLAENPHLGISLERKWGIPTKYHFLICGSHLAFYKVEDKRVNVYRILHGKRNYLAILDLE